MNEYKIDVLSETPEQIQVTYHSGEGINVVENQPISVHIESSDAGMTVKVTNAAGIETNEAVQDE